MCVGWRQVQKNELCLLPPLPQSPDAPVLRGVPHRRCRKPRCRTQLAGQLSRAGRGAEGVQVCLCLAVGQACDQDAQVNDVGQDATRLAGVVQGNVGGVGDVVFGDDAD